ncbi:MAG: hypothetical protein U0470_11000 [Anaerolineae bacterium]
MPPIDVLTGAVDEAVEGRRSGRVRGRVVTPRPAGVTIDDGSGPARVAVLRGAGLGEATRGARPMGGRRRDRRAVGVKGAAGGRLSRHAARHRRLRGRRRVRRGGKE